MTFRKSVLILIFYFICCTDRSLGQLQLNCFTAEKCYNLGYSDGNTECSQKLKQAQNDHKQALSLLRYQCDQKIATNQQDCYANLANEKARCKGQIQLKNNGVAQCNKQLKDNMANMNLAVTKNVRTTITDLSTETRFCIRLTQPECQGQSSTCFWDASLTVTGQQGKGACISARFE